MDKQFIIKETHKYVQGKMSGESTGHDYWHIMRVTKLAKYLGEMENCDLFVVELAALLHDLEDWKFNEKSDGLVENWLLSLNVSEVIINKVMEIINNLSYKGGTVSSFQTSIEGKVVQDADRLDALGAIGIARTFAYGGSKGREIYNPDVLPLIATNFNQYKKNQGTTINHFYEKLLLLKDKMNTKTGQEIAEKRHNFIERYLTQFYLEWNGDDLC